MNEMGGQSLDEYYRQAESWSIDRERSAALSRKIAWIVAGVAAGIALLEAAALIMLLPLKTVVPYTLLVDKQTGYVQELKPLERDVISPDRAMVRSFLAQYVIARESFDINALQSDYRKVALWSAGEARSRYLASMQASNPVSPLASLPRQSQVIVEIRSISSLNSDTALVRFSTIRTDPNSQPQQPQSWAAVLSYRFSGQAMRAEDRLINPLGFQVLRYRKNAETPPEQDAARPGTQPPAGQAAPRPAS